MSTAWFFAPLAVGAGAGLAVWAVLVVAAETWGWVTARRQPRPARVTVTPATVHVVDRRCPYDYDQPYDYDKDGR